MWRSYIATGCNLWRIRPSIYWIQSIGRCRRRRQDRKSAPLQEDRMREHGRSVVLVAAGVALVAAAWIAAAEPTLRHRHGGPKILAERQPAETIFTSAEDNSQQLLEQGRQIFRFDTFGDETFWGDQLHLHQAIATLTPREVLELGLKVDTAALPSSQLQA